MARIDGTSDPRFDALAELLSGSIDRGDDLGASVSVTIEGETVVDIWGGYVDHDRTTEWAENTITNVWSTTKTMMALSALILVDRGELDVYEPVATYWPEFAANGKESIEVRHLMSHTSGVSGWDQPVEVADIYDWEKSTAMLAAQAPWWAPGTASGYHALNQGHLVGEVIRRVSGLKLGDFFAKEVAAPLGVDFHIGLSPTEHGRVSNVIPPTGLPVDISEIDPESIMIKTFTGPMPDASESWNADWRQADIGAANGHGNARSVARAQAVVANGGELDGVRLLSPATIDLIFDQQSDGVDLVLDEYVRFGIGYGLNSDAVPYVPDGRVCYWGGWGGSSIIVDTDRRMTFAYMMNKMADGLDTDPRGEALIAAAYAAIS